MYSSSVGSKVDTRSPLTSVKASAVAHRSTLPLPFTRHLTLAKVVIRQRQQCMAVAGVDAQGAVPRLVPVVEAFDVYGEEVNIDMTCEVQTEMDRAESLADGLSSVLRHINHRFDSREYISEEIIEPVIGLPVGWALDADGQPTSDPAAALAGTLMPMADAKGSALGLMIDILAGVLSGAEFGGQVLSFLTNVDREAIP